MKKDIEEILEILGIENDFKIIILEETGTCLIQSIKTNMSLSINNELNTDFYIGTPWEMIMTKDKSNDLENLKKIKTLFEQTNQNKERGN